MPAQDLTAGSLLSFWHRFRFEPDFDGGVLEVSTDGGTTWKDILDAGGSFVDGRVHGHDRPGQRAARSPAGRHGRGGSSTPSPLR